MPEGSNPHNHKDSSTPQVVVVKGFLVISRLPSKSLLDATLPEIFKNVKIGKKDIKLATGYFYNRLSTLSRKFYTEVLPRYAIDVGFGYIVPKENVPKFLRAVDELKKEYAKFEQQLKKFLLTGEVPLEVKANKKAKVDPEYLKIVKEYLQKIGAWEKAKQKIMNLNIVERVQITLLPFAIDMSILEEYIDEKVRKRIEKELYELRKHMIAAVERQLRKKLQTIIKNLELFAEQKYISMIMLRELKRTLEETERIAKEFNVRLPELDTLKEMLSMPIDQLGKKLVEEKTRGRLKALLEEIAG